MRTYANRVRKDTADSPAKRLCAEVVRPLKDITNLLPIEPLPLAKGKKTISDYFTKPSASAYPSSSDTSPSSDQTQEHIHSSQPSSSETLLSSPPPLGPYNTCVKPLSRKRRRLTTRPRTIKQNKMATPEDYDPGTSSDASSWESSFIGEYTTPEYNTGPSSPKKYSKSPRRARSNTFASLSVKGPGDTGRARSSTTGGHDAEKVYPIPAYSDSSSKTGATTAEPNNGGKGSGQKEVIKPAKLVQTQINLGQNPITTCDVCKFTHNRTVVLDVKAHDRFHQAFVKLAEKLDMDEF